VLPVVVAVATNESPSTGVEPCLSPLGPVEFATQPAFAPCPAVPQV